MDQESVGKQIWERRRTFGDSDAGASSGALLKVACCATTSVDFLTVSFELSISLDGTQFQYLIPMK